MYDRTYIKMQPTLKKNNKPTAINYFNPITIDGLSTVELL